MRLAVVSLLLLSMASAAARADDGSDIAQAVSAVATTRAALRAWAKEQPADLPLADRILALEPPHVSPPYGGVRILAERELERVGSELAAIREDLAWHAEELVLGSAATRADTVTSEVVDVTSLIEQAPDYPRTRPGLPGRIFGMKTKGPGAALSFGDSSEPRKDPGIDGDKLADLVRAICPRVTLLSGKLTFEGSAAERRRVRELLSSLRARLTAARLSLDVRAYALPSTEWASLEHEGLVLAPGAERRLEEAAASGRVRLVGRQVLATIDGQLSGVDLGETRTLILPSDTSAVGTVTPICYRTGLVVETLPRLGPDRQSVLLTAKLRFADFRESHTTKIAGFPVALPELGYARATSDTRIPLGRTGVVSGTFSAAGCDDATGCLVLVTPRLAPAPSSEAEAATGSEPPARHREVLTSAAKAVARIDALVRQLGETAALAHAMGGARLGVFDVRDIIIPHVDYPGPRLGLVQPEGLDAGDSEVDGGLDPDQLVALVKKETGLGCEIHRGEVLVDGTRTELEQVGAALERVHAKYDERISCEASVYSLDPALAAELGGLSPDPAQLSSQALALLDRASADASGRARVLAGGLVSGFAEQRIYVTQGRERLFAAGFEDARVEALYLAARTGFALDVRVRSDGGAARVAGRLSFAPAAAGEKVVAGESELEASTVAATMEPFDGIAPPGGAILLTRQVAGDPRPIAIVIRPTLLSR
jgi:hypothetical protein